MKRDFITNYEILKIIEDDHQFSVLIRYANEDEISFDSDQVSIQKIFPKRKCVLLKVLNTIGLFDTNGNFRSQTEIQNKCPICHKVLSNKSSLKSHVVNIHSEEDLELL
ncbi:MAG: hypothetical protein ABJF65_00230 [Reichenbachiella sp.]|uniref:hypothetical protein n=1 Tax=Reichenbachiella sp. TaxID=2184521 RepID=UPI0032673C08